MAELQQFSPTFTLIGAFLFVGAGIILCVLVIPLVFLLNPKFDPDWKLKRWKKFEREALPFFGMIRPYFYAGAVTSRFLAKRAFGDTDYDFASRVGPFTRFLCRLFISALFLFQSLMVIFSVIYLLGKIW